MTSTSLQKIMMTQLTFKIFICAMRMVMALTLSHSNSLIVHNFKYVDSYSPGYKGRYRKQVLRNHLIIFG